MLCVDTNVLVYGHRADLPEHATIGACWSASPTATSRLGYRNRR